MSGSKTGAGSELIVRLKGGLGNQLFEYAAARALALRNDAALKLDAISGFAYDHQYQRSLKLDSFSIQAAYADRRESFCDLLGRPRRVMARALGRRYVDDSGGFTSSDMRSLRFTGTIYLDGLWQNQAFFSDYEEIVRRDLAFKAAPSAETEELRDAIESSESVSVHVRRLFIPPGASRPVPVEDDVPIPWLTRRPYYEAAIESFRGRVPNPHFFVFSDHPDWARRNLRFPGKATYVEERKGDNQDVTDLRLMTSCRHHIVSASTFSWWGAWLRGSGVGHVCAPRDGWAFPGMPLSAWTVL